MQAGRLDTRIIITRATTSVDEFNTPVETFGEIACVWAHAEPVRDGERMQAGQTIANKAYRFTIRYSSDVSDVDPRDRITFDGRDYDINGVKQIGRREGLEITATARAETPA
jgi:SPP1 family predicted phage head-tail adaptor